MLGCPGVGRGEPRSTRGREGDVVSQAVEGVELWVCDSSLLAGHKVQDLQPHLAKPDPFCHTSPGGLGPVFSCLHLKLFSILTCSLGLSFHNVLVSSWPPVLAALSLSPVSCLFPSPPSLCSCCSPSFLSAVPLAGTWHGQGEGSEPSLECGQSCWPRAGVCPGQCWGKCCRILPLLSRPHTCQVKFLNCSFSCEPSSALWWRAQGCCVTLTGQGGWCILQAQRFGRVEGAL